MKKLFLCLFLVLLSINVQSQTQSLRNVNVSQLSMNLPPNETLTNICQFTFTYTPPQTPKYLNIWADSKTYNPVWLIRNVYLIEKTYSQLDSNRLTERFYINDLGYNDNDTLKYFSFAYSITDTIYRYDTPDIPNNIQEEIVEEDDIYIGHIPDTLYDSISVSFPLDIWADVPQPPVPTNVFDHGCAVPNFDLVTDNSTTYDLNGCGPAATTNSLLWMLAKFGLNFPNDPRKTMEVFNYLMQRKLNEGVKPADFIRAKLDFIEMYNLPITVTYQAANTDKSNSVSSTTGNSKADCSNANDGDYPTLDYITTKGKNDCDEELWFTIGDGDQVSSHVVTLTGGYDLGPNHLIRFKHDQDQTNSDADRAGIDQPKGTVQEEVLIKEDTTGGKKKLVAGKFKIHTGEMENGVLSVAVAECYDPNHKGMPGSVTMSSFCQGTPVIIPPKSKIKLKFPSDAGRDYNVTINKVWLEYDSTQNKWVRKTKREDVFRNNKDSTREVTNDKEYPIIIIIHNDDTKAPRKPGDPKNDFKIDISVELTNKFKKEETNPLSKITGILDSPSNDEVGGGFSLGYSDTSSSEFSLIQNDTIIYDASIGCFLNEAPSRMGSGYCTNYTITYPIINHNPYWSDLDFILDVAKVNKPGRIQIKSISTGITDTINITDIGRYIKQINGVNVNKDTFDLNISLLDDADFEIDCIGVPTRYGLNNAQPSINISSLNKLQYCAGDSIAVNINITGSFDTTNVFSLVLSNDTGSFDQSTTLLSKVNGTTITLIKSSIPLTINEGTKYRIRIESSNPSIISNDNGSDIAIYEKPARPVIVQNGDTLTSNYPNGNQWYLDGNMLLDDTAMTIDIKNNPGKYSDIVTSTQGCESAPSNIIEITNTNVEEISSIIPYYYNPAERTLIIYINTTYKIQTELFNILGTRIFSEVEDNLIPGNQIIIDLNSLKLLPGVYFLRIIEGYKQYYLKIIID